MKVRNKGKVHPFTSSSSSSSSNRDELSVLKLLPAAILTLISLLSHKEREVFAYMITRSLKSTSPSNLRTVQHKKRLCFNGYDNKSPALFDCDCFHCYTSFWSRWDSSPNRELIHQAIEAFEEHLNNGEQFKKNKRKDKKGRRKIRRGGAVAAESPENIQESTVFVTRRSRVSTEEAASQGKEVKGPDNVDLAAVTAPVVDVRSHKGLARKVFPDVMGIFSSRLWSLWSPKV